MSEVRVLVVEDEPIIAENIAMYLNNHDFMVSGIAYDADEARSQLSRNTPDAVILDINIGSAEDGIDIASYINKSIGIPFLFLTSYADKLTLERAKLVEPGGYIVKPFDGISLLASLEIAVSNFARKNISDVPVLSFRKINKYLIWQLTEREFEVLKLIYYGKTNQQIADLVSISVNTVKKHINSSYLKLDVPTRTRAVSRLLELMMR